MGDSSLQDAGGTVIYETSVKTTKCTILCIIYNDAELMMQNHTFWCRRTAMEKDDLTETQLDAARMIAMGMRFGEIAKALNIDRTTIYRWRKLPKFSSEVSELINAARNTNEERLVRDINQIKDIILETLIDVARYDSSGSARVSAARQLTEMIEKAEDRSNQSHVMEDQSNEIRELLHRIQGKQQNSNEKSA